MDFNILASQWPIGNIYSVERYKQGQHNQTYKVVAEKGVYSLRIYNYKKPAQINFELAVLELLPHLPIPHPVKKQNGGYLVKIEKKYALLYNYLLGDNQKVFTSTQLFEVGAFIGECHKALKFAFLSHIFVDYYMRAIKATSKEYFDFIINDLYTAYKTVVLCKTEFYELLK